MCKLAWMALFLIPNFFNSLIAKITHLVTSSIIIFIQVTNTKNGIDCISINNMSKLLFDEFRLYLNE